MKQTQQKNLIIKLTFISFLIFIPFIIFGQSNYEVLINKNLKSPLLLHKELVSIPNLPENKDLMLQNINWVAKQYDDLNFRTTLLETNTLPILIAEKEYDPSYKTVLFYFHIDGQPINP